MTPRSFVCKGDVGITEFKLADLPHGTVPKRFELIDGWDFGPDPVRHVSYAYHMPYGPYALTTSGEPGLAVAADRNPWLDSPFAKARDFSQFKPDMAPYDGTTEQSRCGNSASHAQDGQNIFFLDNHVEFATRAYCGLDDDNIYTVSRQPQAGDPWGAPPKVGSQPSCRKDSLLVNDLPAQKK